MKSLKRGILIVLIGAMIMSGCAKDKKTIPPYDEVLIYPVAYDLTYLRATEAIQNVPGWELETTEKEKGLIRVRNINFTSLDDADQRVIDIWLKPLAAKETSVQLAPESQRVEGGDTLMKSVSEYMKKEIK